MLLFVIEILLIGGVLYYLNNYLRRNFVDGINDKCVLITGTDSGIGLQVALDLDRRGLTVFAGCYTLNGAESMKKQASSKMRIINLDVTDNNSIKTARQCVEANLPRGQGLWAIVNNAGVLNGIVFEWSTIEDYENAMDVNFYGIIRMTNAFFSLIKKSSGRIVNIISISGRITSIPGPYSCSEFAAEAYSCSLRQYASTFGIKVSIIEPGIFLTQMTSKSSIITEFERQLKNLSDAVKKETGYTEDYRKQVEAHMENLTDNFPLVKWNTVDQIVDCVVHAIGSEHPKARYVCGLDAQIIYRISATVLPDWLFDFLLTIIHKQ